MRWLKSLVIVLGLLIIGGVALLGYGFYKKTSDPGWKLIGDTPPAPTSTPASIPTPVPTGPKPPLSEFGNISLNLPAGCFINRARPEGRRLYITTGPKEVCRDVIVVDVTDGRILGTITARP